MWGFNQEFCWTTDWCFTCCTGFLILLMYFTKHSSKMHFWWLLNEIVRQTESTNVTLQKYFNQQLNYVSLLIVTEKWIIYHWLIGDSRNIWCAYMYSRLMWNVVVIGALQLIWHCFSLRSVFLRHVYTSMRYTDFICYHRILSCLHTVILHLTMLSAHNKERDNLCHYLRIFNR